MSIIIYTRNDCVQCHATKRAMESRGVAFEMVNIDQQPEAADTLRAQGFRQLPDQVPAVIGVKGIVGPDPVAAGLDQAGFRQDLHVVGQSRLGNIKVFQDLTGTALPAGEDVDDPQPVRVSQSFQAPGIGFVLGFDGNHRLI